MTTMRSPFPTIAPRVQGQICPVCDQPLANEKMGLVRSRMETRERELTSTVRSRLQEEFAEERARIETAARAATDALRKESALALEKAAREAKEREIAAKEAAIASVREELGQAVARAEQERAAALSQCEALRAEQEQILTARLDEMRTTIERASAEAVTALKVRHFEEKAKLTSRLEELARQLENKAAEERGEGAEVDLFEALKAEFPMDHVRRVARGAAGPDIIHEVVLRDRICGRIVYDCKDRAAWRQDYATKLRSDQLTLGAEHAILSSRVFPTGLRQLGEHGGVLIVNPARVVALVHLLRRHLIRLDALRLGNEERARKTAELYEFMRSEKCLQMFERIDRSAEDLHRLQEKERREHDTRWKRQEALFRTIRQAGSDLRAEIDRIVEATTDNRGELSDASQRLPEQVPASER